MKKLSTVILPLLLLSACTQEIVIDLEEGKPLIGVSASITDEVMRHEAVLSFTTDFYSTESPRMLSDAIVRLTDGTNVYLYEEQEDNPGHYLTVDSFAGVQGRTYTLTVDALNGDDSVHLYAQSFMNYNVPAIDSVCIAPFVMDGVPIPTIQCLYPYFQSLPDPTIVYMVKIAKNDTVIADTLSSYSCIPMAGYAGYYVNGPEMLEKNMLIPIGMFMPDQLHDGDSIVSALYSISIDYMMYITYVMTSIGSNPLMGPPTNVPSNILPKGEAVGWFDAASVVRATTIYHADTTNQKPLFGR